MKHVGTFMKTTPMNEILQCIHESGYDYRKAILEDVGDGLFEAYVLD